jgi:hypothetical protein
MPSDFNPLDFSTENYLRLIGMLLDDGYEITNFTNADPGQKHLLLRHDIDFDLQAAIKIADSEATKGYKSTFFVLLSSEFYNPFTKRSRDAMTAILSCGHELGLHFDTSLHADDETLLSRAAEAECQILESLSERSVDAISMHRPPSRLIGENINFAGRLNVYAPQFTKDMGYCSDSRGAWHHGSPIECEGYRSGMALQLLTHPIWWTQQDPVSPQHSVASFLQDRQDFLGAEAERNCMAYTHLNQRKQHDS